MRVRQYIRVVTEVTDVDGLRATRSVVWDREDVEKMNVQTALADHFRRDRMDAREIVSKERGGRSRADWKNRS